MAGRTLAPGGPEERNRRFAQKNLLRSSGAQSICAKRLLRSSGPPGASVRPAISDLRPASPDRSGQISKKSQKWTA